MILKRNHKIVGVYRLIMKTESDNFRTSAIQDIIKNLKQSNVNIIIYEPTLDKEQFDDCVVVNNLNKFKNTSDIIIANRLEKDLIDVLDKVYTRDIYNNN